MHQLSFTQTHSYAGRDTSIALPVVLTSGARHVDLVASLDTGASHCLFENGYAVELGLDVTAGRLMRFRTANSTFDAFGHELEIEVLGIVTRSTVYFFADAAIRKHVLGRGGWLDRVRVGLVDHDRQLFLAPHGAPESSCPPYPKPPPPQSPTRSPAKPSAPS